MPASQRRRSEESAETPPVESSNSGKCTSPSPRSARGSSAHRSAIVRVSASNRRAAAAGSAASPATRPISSAISCICLPDLRNPSALPRSRWRRSRATRRRAASSTSTVTASRRSAYRTALVSTADSPASRAMPAIRAACGVVPGPQSPRRPGSRCETSSTTRWERGTSARHGSSAARARSSRRRVAATASSDPGPSSTIRSPLASSSATSGSSPRSRLCRSRTGDPRSPASWTAEISRHTAAHPARPPRVSAAARNVARGSPPRSAGRSRNAPPRAGVLRSGVRCGGDDDR